MASVRKKRPTIKQVAKEAGVCRATVSHALSGKRPVSESMKQRVLQVADQLGYRPHYLAQNLIRGYSKAIAVLVRDLINPYNPLYLQAIEQAASDRGYRVYVCVVGTDRDKISNYLDKFSNGQADGVLIVTSAVEDDAILHLLERGYPVVAPLRTIPGHQKVWPSPVDVKGAFRKLLDYLHDLGHRQFGFMWHIRSHLNARIEALTEFLAENNVSITPEQEVENVLTIEQAIVAAEKLLRENPNITALVCANDMTAAGSLFAARKMGLTIPDDLSITGFGDIPMSRYCNPGITTVQVPIEQIADAAIRMLLQRIETGSERNGFHSLPDLDLMIRGTTGACKKPSIPHSKEEVCLNQAMQ